MTYYILYTSIKYLATRTLRRVLLQRYNNIILYCHLSEYIHTSFIPMDGMHVTDPSGGCCRGSTTLLLHAVSYYGSLAPHVRLVDVMLSKIRYCLLRRGKLRRILQTGDASGLFFGDRSTLRRSTTAVSNLVSYLTR